VGGEGPSPDDFYGRWEEDSMIDGGPVPLITQFDRIDRFLYRDDG
jgi:hypothetical protein